MKKGWGFVRRVGAGLLLISAVPEKQYIDHSLQSLFYLGKPLHMSVDTYTSNLELVPIAPLITFEVPYADFPVLIGFDLPLLKEYAFTSGALRKPEQGFGQFSGERVQFSDVRIGAIPMIKASFLDNATPPNKLMSVAYYPHDGSQSTASFTFPFLSIFKDQKAPYYQEILQRAKPTHSILPNPKGNQPIIKGETFTFYHLDRNDGYIETYGFRKPKGNELKGVEQILVLQTVYPAAQMAELAGPLTELFVKEVQQHQAVWGY